MNKTLKRQLQTLPSKPGVYTFTNEKGKVLYVGKATSLKSRVSSYFTKRSQLPPSKQLLIERIAGVRTIVTTNPIEALLLEATLIKEHQPPFNVVLKDDKSFVYVKINLTEPFPKIERTRRLVKDGSRFFGPYTSAGAISSTLKLLKKIFPYRTCDNPPERPCFEFELGRCAGHGDREAQRRYRSIVDGVVRFLRGDTGTILRELQHDMRTAAGNRAYERAAAIRDRIAAMKTVIEKQAVANLPKDSLDAVGIANDGTRACLAILLVRNGKLLDDRTLFLAHALGESSPVTLESGLEQYYSRCADPPKTILLPFPVSAEESISRVSGARLVAPSRGRNRRLVGLANENAHERLVSAKASWERDEIKAKRALAELQTILNLPRPPKRIEAFDVSNVSGEHAVGSMVVFLDGMPAKREYRKFRIRTVRGSNDPAMMAEVLKRRFGHTTSRGYGARSEEQEIVRSSPRAQGPKSSWPLPDLIILDGGSGQLNLVTRALRGEKRPLPPIVAIAKGGHAKPNEMADRERIFQPGRPAVKLNNPSDSLFLIERIRDEAHRFAIRYFRGRHRKAAIRSVLDDVPGIGPATKRKLLREFGSLRGVRAASEAELARVVGAAIASRVRTVLAV